MFGERREFTSEVGDEFARATVFNRRAKLAVTIQKVYPVLLTILGKRVTNLRTPWVEPCDASR